MICCSRVKHTIKLWKHCGLSVPVFPQHSQSGESLAVNLPLFCTILNKKPASWKSSSVKRNNAFYADTLPGFPFLKSTSILTMPDTSTFHILSIFAQWMTHFKHWKQNPWVLSVSVSIRHIWWNLDAISSRSHASGQENT